MLTFDYGEFEQFVVNIMREIILEHRELYHTIMPRDHIGERVLREQVHKELRGMNFEESSVWGLGHVDEVIHKHAYTLRGKHLIV